MRRLILALCVLLLAACEPARPDDALPTLIVLPSEEPASSEDSGVQVTAAAVHNETQAAALAETQTALAATIAADAASGTQAVAPTHTETATSTAQAAPTDAAPPLIGTATPQGPTLTPSMTITDTPTRTPTHTPVGTGEQLSPLFQLAILALSSTPPPTGVYVAPTAPPVVMPPPTADLMPTAGIPCVAPPGGFAAAYAVDLILSGQIGCSLGAPLPYPAASQAFERGIMVYVGTAPAAIYVLYNSGTYARLPDTWLEGVDPESGGEAPPAGLLEPIRGFGKLWRTDPTVRSGLGWATQPEAGTTVTLLQFQNGHMISIPTLGQIAILTNAGTYRLVSGGA